MKHSTIATLALLAAAFPAAAWAAKIPAPVPVDAGGDLTWIVRPDSLQAGKIIARYGYRKGDGATVDCRLGRDGRPIDCVAVSDSHADSVRLASEVARLFKAASKDSLGQPVVGRKVRFGFGVAGTRDP